MVGAEKVTLFNYHLKIKPLIFHQQNPTSLADRVQIWTAHHYAFTQPRTLITSGSLGTMGYGLPAAIGAAAAHPEKSVICVS
jgi:glyoxylate carboligase